MELRHLRYFIAVAEELHFGRAARRLGIAQPPLSLQIRQLEVGIDVRLFQRTKRRVQLTDAGRAFLQEAYRVIAQAERAVHVARQVDRGTTGRVSMGFVNAAIYSVVPDVLRTFRGEFPAVVVDLHELTSQEQIHDLLNGRIDLGLLRPPVNDEALFSRTVLREPFVVAMPASHALASEREIDPSALAPYPFLMATRQEGPTLYDESVGLCRDAGFAPAVVQEADHMQTIIGLVAGGMGVALVPDSIRHLQRAGVVYRPLRRPGRFVDIVAAWRRDNASACLGALLGILADLSAARHQPGRRRNGGGSG